MSSRSHDHMESDRWKITILIVSMSRSQITVLIAYVDDIVIISNDVE